MEFYCKTKIHIH